MWNQTRKSMWNQASKSFVLLLGLWFGFDWLSHLFAENFWFQEVGYLRVFWLRLGTQAAIWTIVTLGSAWFLLSNLAQADRLKPQPSKTPYSNAPNVLLWLIPLAVALSLLIEALLLHYGQTAASFWQINQALPDISPVSPTQFRLDTIAQICSRLFALEQGGVASLQLIALAGFAIALLIYPRFLLTAIAIGFSLGFGFILSCYWGKVLQALHATSFNQVEPLFNRDVSDYVFFLPIAELLQYWLIGLFVYGFVAVCLLYLLSGNSLSEGTISEFSPRQQRHLSGLGGCLMLAIALSYWVSRYKLLYSTRGVAYGASYTDIVVQLPAYTALSIAAGAIALYLFYRAGFNSKFQIPNSKLFYGLVAYGLIAAIGIPLLSISVQRFAVQPNELARERPYIERGIAKTREAFNLTEIDAQTFNPQNDLTLEALQKNALTIRNIRLWDTRPLLQTNRQLQQIRSYYTFFDADIDRYTLLSEQSKRQTEKQQVLIAARELDYNNVPPDAKTWVNEHLTYTHGYGFTLSPVNRAAPGGLPDYFVRDIGVEAPNQGSGNLRLSSQQIRASIPIENPRLYYGESANTYVMTSTKVQEFDYPSGNENAYNTYDGRGGIKIAALWRRLVFANYLKDWQMLLTNDFTEQTKLLFRRNINERIRAIAPFLRYDQNPYLVVADVKADQGATPNHLYWIVDAYTTSDRYPYSDPGEFGFNYIRNSVKVVIDAYNGSVNFYVADAKDPMIQSWSAIFPNLFKSIATLPPALLSHIRYPIDLFNSQAERLIAYHMTDPQVFYNREDQWQVPNEIYGNKPQPVEPYYLITKLPTAASEEFILLLPYTPNQRPNLIAWLAARSDGENYGKLLLYTFPKQELVFGTEQIEARINQDPVISQQISLWNREGSRAVQGNLLVIPIERSLLYVEPLYLEAEQNSLPTLVRVIVAYENRIAMAPTLDEALRAIFQPASNQIPAIVRPVE